MRPLRLRLIRLVSIDLLLDSVASCPEGDAPGLQWMQRSISRTDIPLLAMTLIVAEMLHPVDRPRD